MKINKKIVIAGFAGLICGYLLGMIAGTIKLLTLGESTWSGSYRLFGLPVMYINSNSQGFEANTEWGVFALALIGATVALLFTYLQVSKKS